MPPKKKQKKASSNKKNPAAKFFYVIRACKEDGTSHVNFKWPSKGPVSAPRFVLNGRCGDGLHGWASLEHIGRGAPYWFEDRNIATYHWLLVRVPFRYRGRINYQKLDPHKVKFKHGYVVQTDNFFPTIRKFALLTKGKDLP
jgi:hypothetical protein